MRLQLLAVGLVMLLTASGFDSVALAQRRSQPGFLVTKDENGRVVSAVYYGSGAIRRILQKAEDPDAVEFFTVDQLHAFPFLREIFVFYGHTLNQKDIAHLAKCQGLKYLELGFVGVDSEYVTIEGGTAGFAKLKSLESISFCKEKMSDDDLKFVASLTKLKRLEFNSNTNGVGNFGPTATDRCAEYLSQSKSLESIVIQFGEAMTDQFVAKVSAGLPDLQELEIYSPSLSNESLRMLAKGCKNLKTLRICSNRFTDDGIKHLEQAARLERLFIESNLLTTECFRSVGKLSRLERLELTTPTIDDKSMQALAKLQNLEFLALRRQPMTDAQFAMFRNHPRLESAFINGRNLTEAKVVQIIVTLPQLTNLRVGSQKLQNAIDRTLSLRQKNRSRENKSSP